MSPRNPTPLEITPSTTAPRNNSFATKRTADPKRADAGGRGRTGGAKRAEYWPGRLAAQLVRQVYEVGGLHVGGRVRQQVSPSARSLL